MSTPSLADVLMRAIVGALDDVRVMLPGRVTAYDDVSQRASIELLVSDEFIDDDGVLKTAPLPILTDVPVVFAGHGTGRITWPVAKGDTVEVRFASSSLVRWKVSGGKVTPGDRRHHALADAVAYSGLEAKPTTSAPANAIVTHGATKIGGATGTQPTIMANSFFTSFDTLIAAIASAVGSITGGSGAGASITAALTAFQAARSTHKTVNAEVK